MKLARFEADGRIGYGNVEGDRILEVAGGLFDARQPTGRAYALKSVRLLAPVSPGKVVCVGKNYAAHAAEFGGPVPEEPCLFMKPASAVIGPGAPIVYPAMSAQVDYEAELAVVIGKRLRHATAEEARAGVLGFTCLNDVTARDLQRKDGQWTRAKSFDTFCPPGTVDCR